MKALKKLSLLFTVILFSSCVQKTQSKTITLRIDMNAIENASEVGVRGSSPLYWNETTYLSDKDNSGIYEKTIEFSTANNTLEFKFVNNNDEFELHEQSNRILNFEYKPEIMTYEAKFNNLKDVIILRY